MFKEAFVTVLCFAGIYFIIRFLLRKNRILAQRLIAAGLLLTLLLNTVYNLRELFPSLILDDEAFLGDAKDNLFLYNKDSQYPEQILFPVLQNRNVLADDSASFYTLFLNTFSGSVKEISLSDEYRDALLSRREELTFSAPLCLVTLLDYAFPDNGDLAALPTVYLDESELAGQDTLIALADSGGNLYIFAESTYQEVIGHESE